MKGYRQQVTVFSLLLFFLLFTVYCTLNPVYARGEGLGQSQITPASPLYFLKSVREILELKFAGTSKVEAFRQLEFSTRRIREVKGLVKTSHQDLIEPTLARYLALLQQFNSVANYSNEVLAAQIVESTSLHMSALQTVYPQVSNPRARMSIRAAIYRLTVWDQEFIKKLHNLSKPHLAEKVLPSRLSGCSFLSKEASSSALSEIERVILTERAKNCFKAD